MRLFIAATFPDAVIRDLNQRVAGFRSRLPSASWVRSETQHLTFAFLGEQDAALIDRIAPTLRERLAAIPRFEGRIRGCGFFPNPHHARVGWVGLDPEEGFGKVAAVVREVVEEEGVHLDRAEFRAHLTLMRLKDRWPPASIDLFSRSLRDYASEPFAVDHATLFSSELKPTGAVHTPVQTYRLN
ncbi:MAG: RNA 2',3'-cyclic phosphodiesterase [Thermoanaerobaculia bacterium]